ncbi:uncharacterized protein Dvar_48750 [Desulfosarcina variabilis str. Montpellier]|uniref:hypothetical protein n=1 Tax=Desulfosarcina variabilis TaxID=2300 RepID=UPI003AFA0543
MWLNYGEQNSLFDIFSKSIGVNDSKKALPIISPSNHDLFQPLANTANQLMAAPDSDLSVSNQGTSGPGDIVQQSQA